MAYRYTLNQITLTDAGRALLQRAIGGEELAFSSVALGNGVPPNNFAYSGLVSEKLRVSTRKVTSYSNKTIINTVITNALVETAFNVYEIGVFAIDPSTSNEVLYAYGYFSPATDSIPAASTSIIEEIYEVEVYTSNATNITATIDPSLVYALQSDLEDLETEVANAKSDIRNIQQNYALITATGSKILASYNSTTNVVTLTLKNANNTTLSTATFTVPISETFINCTYSNGNLTFTQKNGTTKQVDISGLISTLVPNSRTIAGVDLVDNITKAELMTALGMNPNGNNCPSGMIVMWSGTIASIPEGWKLCNGQNGTPDLRNRFIVGAGDEYSVGDTGGSNTVALTVDQIPQHNHSYSYHTTMDRVAGSSSQNKYNVGSLESHTTGNAGGGQAHENRPPYYALCFIMKV